MKRKLKIIFHHPLPIGLNTKSASGIRPQKMLRAFQELGHELEVVVGYALERKKKIKEIKTKIAEGKRYDFVYAESSTMPTCLTSENHLPWHPLLEFSFFRFLSKKQVPIYLFYRDIYWRFENYDKKVKGLKNVVAKAFYWWDLFQYRKYIRILYLPSKRMAAYVPLVPADRIKALPPGLKKSEFANSFVPSDNSDQRLHLLYIGGVTEHYKLHKLFCVMRSRQDIFLTICTRKEEWAKIGTEYLPKSLHHIDVLHKNTDEIEELYQNSDLALVFIEPSEYWEFAMPFKLFEYIGHGKPIIASEGTAAADFVEENKVGWTIPYEADALNDLISRIKQNRQLIEVATVNCARILSDHTWEARAKRVIQDCLNEASVI